jgi:hypothetical protein
MLWIYFNFFIDVLLGFLHVLNCAANIFEVILKDEGSDQIFALHWTLDTIFNLLIMINKGLQRKKADKIKFLWEER